MSLPPDRITVKRRRDEDPIEALFVRSKKQRPSAVWRLQSTIHSNAKQSISNSGVATSKPEKTPTPNPQASPDLSSRPPISKGVEDDAQHDNTTLFQNTREGLIGDSSSQKPKRAQGVSRPILPSRLSSHSNPKLRHFYLSRDSLTASLRRSSSPGGISKQKKGRKEGHACFVERRGDILGSIEGGKKPLKTTSLSTEANEHEKRSVDRGPSRRKPNVSIADRARREKQRAMTKDNKFEGHRTQGGENDKISGEDRDSELLELAKELQQFAFAECLAQQQQPVSKVSSMPSSNLEVKEAAPHRLEKTRTIELDPPNIMVTGDDNGGGSDVDDYVVDTYVRFAVGTTDKIGPESTYFDPANQLQTESVGVLVVEEEDEAYWQTYADELESETDSMSDEEDENAETYYGNDYPEDDVDFDDEYGRASYSYRHNASSDEEFGEDEMFGSPVED